MLSLTAKFLPRRLSVRTLGWLITAIFVFLYVSGNELLDTLELKTYDMRLRAQTTRAPSGAVTIVAIDEKSLKTEGRWPWSRQRLARLIDSLAAAGAGVIALDMFFPESEHQKLLDHIAQLERERGHDPVRSPYRSIKQALATDAEFARALARAGNVILSFVFLMTRAEAEHLDAGEHRAAIDLVRDQAIGVIRTRSAQEPQVPLAEPAGLLVNRPELQRAARYSGHINSLPDRDGTLRQASLVLRYQGLYFPSADVQAVRALRASGNLILNTAAYGIEGLHIGNRLIDTDEYGGARLHYYGAEGTIPTISASDVLAGRIEQSRLRDKIVLIGATAKGIGDIRVTPYGAAFPGVEIRATIIENLLQEHFIKRPGWVVLIDVAAILLIGIFLSLLLPKRGVLGGALTSTLLLGAYASTVIFAFSQGLLWLNLTLPIALIVLIFMSATIVKYFAVESEKLHIKSAFQHYVTPSVVDELIRDIDKLRLGGEKRELTVLFSDIRGFTSVAERMQPEELVHLLNVYLTKMTEKVFAHHGLLDKYIGDAIMAVYGAPIARADHARLACLTALDMQRELRALHELWRREGAPLLEIGIGINSGPMIVGNMGSENRFDYTVIGDAVNLGARVESLNKIYGTRILITEFTYRLVEREFRAVREVDISRVRGRNEVVRLYELLLEDNYPNFDWLDDYREAYELFHRGAYAKAAPIFERLARDYQDALCAYYFERAQAPKRTRETKG